MIQKELLGFNLNRRYFYEVDTKYLNESLQLYQVKQFLIFKLTPMIIIHYKKNSYLTHYLHPMEGEDWIVPKKNNKKYVPKDTIEQPYDTQIQYQAQKYHRDQTNKEKPKTKTNGQLKEEGKQETKTKKKKKYMSKEGSLNSTQLREGQHRNSNGFVSLENILPSGDWRRFKKLCANILRQKDRIQIKYSINRPLILCQFKNEGKTEQMYMADVVHKNRVNKVIVDIELLWRTYDLLYKQVSEDFWGIAKFGMLRAEEKKKQWTKKVNIYKHKQFLKLYYVVERYQIHFLLLHKDFRRVEYSASYIEDNKLKLPHEYRAFEKFKKYLKKEKDDEEIEGFEEVDSEEESLIQNQVVSQREVKERLGQLLNKDMDWVISDLHDMKEKLDEMDFDEKRDNLLKEGRQIEKMYQRYLDKRSEIKLKFDQDQMSFEEMNMCLKMLVISERQIESKLPVCYHKDKIFSLLDSHQLIILAGETGSGKSTQLPQMLFEYYKLFESQQRKPVLITQPRKIAARTLAERVAYELEEKKHGVVGYQTSSNKKVSPKSKIIFKLDRLVLDEMTTDCLLQNYSCLVIDQAHERTLSIDVILGRIKMILSKRKDFKIIITSASMDIEKLRNYYQGYQIQCIRIPGRMFPVTEIFEPVNNVKSMKDKIETFMKNHLFEIGLEQLKEQYNGHILVFCPGLQELEQLVQKFRNLLNQRSFRVLPLHGKLTPEQQKLVFKEEGKKKIIFATKIAQTSITIDNIRVVVNIGLDKALVYDQTTKITTFQLRMISQSEALQRAGRAGRTAPGFCFHLYSKNQCELMEAKKVPQMQNMPLETVVLRLKALSVDDIYEFSFIDPPSVEALKISMNTLKMLGCISLEGILTEIGRLILKIPLEPFLARSIIESLFYASIMQKMGKDSERDITDEVIKTLCVIVNSENLYVRNSTESSLAEIPELQSFQGQFDLYLKLFNEFIKSKNPKEWTNRNGLSLKALLAAKQAYEQIKTVMKLFVRDLETTNLFKEQSKKREPICKTFQKQNDLLNASLVSSFVNHLCLYSEVPQLGYTLIAQKTPIVLDSSTILSKKQLYPKWLVCYNIFTDQFNRVTAKVCQPITFDFLRKCVDPQIFSYFGIERAEQQNPFYYKFEREMPSLIIDKIVSDSQNKNFDETLSFLVPFTFVIDDRKNKLTVYHLSGQAKQAEIEKVLDNYIEQVLAPLNQQYMYQTQNKMKAYFDGELKLIGLKMKDQLFEVEISGYTPEQKLIQINKMKMRRKMEKSRSHWYNGLVQGKDQLNQIKQIMNPEDNIQTIKYELVGNEYEMPELRIFFDVNFIDADEAIIQLSYQGQLNRNDIQEIAQQIPGLKYIEYIRKIQCYSHTYSLYFETGAIPEKSVFQKLRSHPKNIQRSARSKNPEFNPIDIQKQINSALKKQLQWSLFQQFQLSFIRQYVTNPKSSQQTARTPLQAYQLKKKRKRYIFKLTSRDPKVLSVFKNYCHIKQYGQMSVQTWNNTLVQQIPTNVFEIIQNYFYQEINTLLQNKNSDLQISHQHSVNFKGIQNTGIIIKKKVGMGSRFPSSEISTKRIMKIISPIKIPNLSKYSLIFKDVVENHGTKPSPFIQRIEEKWNYEAKLLFDEKRSVLSIYCPQSLKDEIHNDIMKELDKIETPQIIISYAKKGLKCIQKVLEKAKCSSYSVNYQKKEIVITSEISYLGKIKAQIEKLEDALSKQCEICCENFFEPYKLLVCHHIFCSSCLKNWILSNRQSKSCPLRCGKAMSVYDVKKIIEEQVFSDICEFLVKQYIESCDEYFYCYSPDCCGVIQTSQIDQYKSFSCWKCKKSYCTDCQQISHKGKKCRKYIDEEEQLAKMGIKKCPKCNQGVQKNEGCNHMKCRCGNHFCWKCMKEFSSSTQCYQHLRILHGGIYDDHMLNQELQQLQDLQRRRMLQNRLGRARLGFYY